jgi:hypothetical protein
MTILDAESFGLAQLHQLRGRVARGAMQGICGAVVGSQDAAHPRVDAFVSTTDGFALAQQDLLLRGPGDLVGTRQSGAPPLHVADLVEHAAVVAEARRDALALFERDQYLADPARGSIHSFGMAVDVTLLDANGLELDMGTAFDAFTPHSHHGNLEISTQAQKNRLLLMGIMTTAGWDFYRNEWWHYQLFNSRDYTLYADANAGGRML